MRVFVFLAHGYAGDAHEAPASGVEPCRAKTKTGVVLGPDQRIDRMSALRAVTIDAAWQVFMDDDIGSIEPGKLADLVVLSGVL